MDRKMPKGFFITGTDTGVGKTVISGALIKVLGFLGFRTGAMKPVESGCSREGSALIPVDGMFLKQTARMDDPINSVTPFCLESPLAPLTASEEEGKPVSIGVIVKQFEALAGKYDAMIVEGIGGLMVPVRQDYFVLDLAADLGLPLLIVARPGLGTINHTLLTIRCAEEKGLKVAGIIINYCHPPENTLAEKTNPGLLAQLSHAPLLGVFPWLDGVDEDLLARNALKHLDLSVLKQYL